MRNGTSYRAALKSQTAELLEGLGASAEDVAANLEASGVRGIPRSRTDCAVARYLHAVLGADPRLRSIAVGSSEVTIEPASRWSPRVVVNVPPAVRSFIIQFDRCAFSSLLAESPKPRRGVILGMPPG